MRERHLGLIGVVMTMGMAGLFAQAPATPTPIMTERSAGSEPLDRLAFRAIGPATPSGRVDDLAVLESDPATFYVAMATSGIYKTTNGGTTFTTVFDHEGTGSVGAVAIAATDPNLVWAGTGENNNRQSSSWGDGVYKSTDGGRSWRNMGLRASKQIARVIVDPVDFDVVYVAALGDLWAAGGERGVYKTSDGGATWQRVLFVDDDTGATELRDGSLEQQDALRRDLPAAPRAMGHERRRPRQRHLEVDRCRADVDADRDRPAGRAEGPHRHGHLPPQSERALRARRAPRRKRRLSHGRRRGQLAQVERRQPAPDVLQPDSRRSADRFPHLRARRLAARLGRRRPHLPRTTAPSASTSIITRCGSTRRTRSTF